MTKGHSDETRLLDNYPFRKYCRPVIKVWRARVFSPRWIVATVLAFLLTYLLLPWPAQVVQLEWPPPEEGRNTEEAGGGGSSRGKVLLGPLANATVIFSDSSSDPQHHRHRYKFIYSRKRLNLVGRPKINLIPEQVQWCHDPGHLCVQADPPPLAVTLVLSSVTYKARRTFIRNTWARPAWYPHTRLKTVFVLGATTNSTLQDDVDKEARAHSDIVQYNFTDSYANLTYKTLSLLSWGVTRCPDAFFLVKVDDDVLLNPFHLRGFLEDALKHTPSPNGVLPGDEMFRPPPDANPATAFIYGRYDARPYPLRYTKWSLTTEEYPENVYPPFVHGPAYLVGNAAARELLRFAPYVSFLKLEDVYTTGLVAFAAGIKHVQISGQVTAFQAGPDLYNGSQAILEGRTSKERDKAWQEILKYAPKV